MKLSPRNIQVNLRISSDLKREAEAAAQAENRSLTSLIEKLLLDHMRATGQIKASRRQ